MRGRPTALVSAILAAAVPAAAGSRAYVVDPAASEVKVRVGRAGLFKFAGHEHEVLAPIARGEVTADEEDVSRSSVRLEFESAGLRVTGKGEPAEDVPKVQEAMAGPKVLESVRFPTIRFESRSVSGRPLSPGLYELTVAGDLTLRSLSRSLTVPLRVQLTSDGLVATGTAIVRQTDFGIQPISVAGVVKVKNELAIAFRVVALFKASRE